jgi:hypothetical protein
MENPAVGSTLDALKEINSARAYVRMNTHIRTALQMVGTLDIELIENTRRKSRDWENGWKRGIR